MSSIVIAGDTSGTITLQAPAVAGSTTFNLPATSGTLLNDATVGVCRAWVNFNGTGTVAIRASFNVSSITDNGTGNYTLNFTTAMPNNNYAVCAAANASATEPGTADATVKPYNQATTSVSIGTTINGALFDDQNIGIAIFR